MRKMTQLIIEKLKKEEKKEEKKEDNANNNNNNQINNGGNEEGYRNLPQEDFDIPEDFDVEKTK